MLLISVSAIVEVAGQAYLYHGFLDEYFTDKDGQLDRIVLTATERRRIEQDRAIEKPIQSAGENEPDVGPQDVAVRFYPITGDYFVLRYSEIITLNIHYYRAEVPTQKETQQS